VRGTKAIANDVVLLPQNFPVYPLLQVHDPSELHFPLPLHAFVEFELHKEHWLPVLSDEHSHTPVIVEHVFPDPQLPKLLHEFDEGFLHVSILEYPLLHIHLYIVENTLSGLQVP